jgi:PEP-CTERM motif
MRKRRGESDRRLVNRVMLGMMLAFGAVPGAASAGVVTFTWNPAGAFPSLSGDPAFTANGIVGKHYLYDVTPPAGSPMIYPVYFIEQIEGFTLNGAPVSTPGLNGAPGAPPYGLYLRMQAEVQQAGAGRIYHSLAMSLMADPGNNDGAVSSTFANQLAFANTGPTGTADDITLANGSLLSGTFKMNPAPGIIILSDFKETFQPAPGEADFFASPVSPYTVIEELLTTPIKVFQTEMPDGPDGPTIATLNGGAATIDLRVPEPASVVLFGSGLLTLVAVRRRRRS